MESLSLPLLIGILVISLYILTKGADFLVHGASDFARYMKISPILIGLTIVALGTSLPEFIVSLVAVFTKNPDISLGNIVGSNICNIGLILGLSALFMPLVVRSTTLTYEFPFLIISSFLLVILANDHYFFEQTHLTIGRIDGIIFVGIFVYFLAYIYRMIKKQRDHAMREFKKEYKHKNPGWKNFLLIAGGIIMLSLGGRFFVGSSSAIAAMFNISEAFIGLTIVAVGTSLPELFTSVVAAYKKEGDIAVGNIIGSNIFNILMVLGIVGIIKPIQVNAHVLYFDAIIMLIFTLVFVSFSYLGSNLRRWEGGLLLFLYIAYIAFLIFSL